MCLLLNLAGAEMDDKKGDVVTFMSRRSYPRVEGGAVRFIVYAWWSVRVG